VHIENDEIRYMYSGCILACPLTRGRRDDVGDRGSTFESRSHERMGSIMYPFRMQVITIGIGMGHLIPSLEPILVGSFIGSPLAPSAYILLRL
jgi:hypothetical protein